MKRRRVSLRSREKSAKYCEEVCTGRLGDFSSGGGLGLPLDFRSVSPEPAFEHRCTTSSCR